MTQKYTALPAFPFIFRHWGDTYAVVGVNEQGNTKMIALSTNGVEKPGHVYEDNIPALLVLRYLNDGSYTLVSPAPQEEAAPETTVAKATTLDPLVIRVDTTDVERALAILAELEASVTRVKALIA